MASWREWGTCESIRIWMNRSQPCAKFLRVWDSFSFQLPLHAHHAADALFGQGSHLCSLPEWEAEAARTRRSLCAETARLSCRFARLLRGSCSLKCLLSCRALTLHAFWDIRRSTTQVECIAWVCISPFEYHLPIRAFRVVTSLVANGATRPLTVSLQV